MGTLLTQEVEALAPGERVRVSPVSRSLLACLAADWAERNRRGLVLIFSDVGSALSAVRDIQVYSPTAVVALAVPATGCERARAPGGIHILRSSENAVLATTVEALGTLYLFATPGHLLVGQRFGTREEFLGLLSRWGYPRGEEPLREGEFLVRGETAVLRLLGGPKYRLEFFGETLEEISGVLPAGGGPIVRLEVPRALAEFSPRFLTDLIPESVEIWGEDTASLAQAFQEAANKVENEDAPGRLADAAVLRRWLEDRVHKVFEDFPADGAVDLGVEPTSLRMSTSEVLDEFLKRLPKWAKSVYAFVSEGFPLRGLLADRGVFVRRGPLSEGWVARRSGIIALTDMNLLPHDAGEPFESRLSLSHFRAGDLVVQEDHGIAIYRGLEHQRSGDVEKDYLVLEYEGGARLYLPVEHAYKVHRYIGVSGQIPLLSRLGGRQWKRALRRVREATAHEARELYNLYRKRLEARGHRHGPDTDWQTTLEQSFPYQETPDQRTTAAEVKQDMESERAMDRLVIGDVGFGKTEIAVRAAFKAVMSGTQVAVLAPTTVLTYQHYLVFRKRMAAFPVEIALMSRFRSVAANAAVAASLARGATDIVIGTHRLLARDVSFKRLGLLIVDEEQRFGVYHKEKLKLRFPEVDVLTLSATPIPRTLYQTLIQIKGISYVRTPPEGRRPIITRAGPYSQEASRKAIQTELDRGGQVFYLYNRVEGLDERADRIQGWFPSVRVATAHGRLRPCVLEKALREFIAGDSRILVSTTLMENGVDIPGADTLIVEDSERYGLAELHQLRGRIGRSDRQAHAYFFVNPEKPLPSGARERLMAIARYSYLGAGFELSYRDLELRGAGELLGRKQHGFAALVGLVMYARSLGNALAPLVGKKVSRRARIDIPAGAFIPSDYIAVEAERARVYEQILQTGDHETLERVARELERVYGHLPLPVKTLLDLAYIRTLAEASGVDRVELDSSGRIARFEGGIARDLIDAVPGVREVQTDPGTGKTRFLVLIRRKPEGLEEIRRVLERTQEAALRISAKVM
jgi:transcription-repair coupling factor (superfamily II helicase)